MILPDFQTFWIIGVSQREVWLCLFGENTHRLTHMRFVMKTSLEELLMFGSVRDGVIEIQTLVS